MVPNKEEEKRMVQVLGNILREYTMTKARRPSRIHRKVGWKDICPTCVKYDYPDHSPDCPHCHELGITESILCSLNRMDQEDSPSDFQREAYQSKYSLQ